MRTPRSAVALVALAVAIGLTACSGGDSQKSLPTPSKAFCQAAYDYDTNVAKLVGKIAEQTALVRKMAEHAPADVKADAETYLDAMERRARGDTSVVDNPRVKAAVEHVERRAADDCGLYKQEPPSGM